MAFIKDENYRKRLESLVLLFEQTLASETLDQKTREKLNEHLFNINLALKCTDQSATQYVKCLQEGTLNG